VTELARELLRGVRRLKPSTVGPPEQGPAGSAIEVQVRVPTGIAPAAITGLEQQLHELFDQRIRELGINRGLSVLIEPAQSAGPTVDVSVDGRPAASDVVAPGGDDVQGWPAAVTVGVDRALRRHLSLLLDDLDTDRCAAKIGAIVSDGSLTRYRMVPGYLLDNGLSLNAIDNLRLLPGALDECETGFEIGEVILNAVAPREVTVELAEATLRNCADDVRRNLLGTREKIYSEIGVHFPDVKLVITDTPPGVVYVGLNHVRLPEVRIPEVAGWQDVVGVLHDALRAHVQWFLRTDDVEAARGVLSDALPDLVRLSRNFYGSPLLTGCLRSLVRNGDNVHNLPRILWLLLEAGSAHAGIDVVRLAAAQLASSSSRAGVQRNPDMLASGLRKWVAAEAWQVGAAIEGPQVVRLPLELETALIAPPDAAALAEAEWHAVKAVGLLDGPSQVVTHSMEALRPVRDGLSALPQPPRVVASLEFPPDAELPST